MKTTEDLRKFDIQKLLQELDATKKDFFKIKFDVENGQSKNTHLTGRYRKQLARIKTLINHHKITNNNNATEKGNRHQ
jgi:ribosomal protein L29